jgi:hypothetical protein
MSSNIPVVKLDFSLKETIAERKALNVTAQTELLLKVYAKSFLDTFAARAALRKAIDQQTGEVYQLDLIKTFDSPALDDIIKELHEINLLKRGVFGEVMFDFLDTENNKWTMIIHTNHSVTFRVAVA